MEGARRRIAGHVLRTPIILAPRFPGLSEAPLYLKLENLQRTGAFKIRGATNRIARLSPEERRRGVITASAGNHAQGVAWAARALGIPATIVMAERASPLKVSATQALGARVVRFGSDYDEAFEHALSLAKQEGLTLIHPFDDPDVIAGQASVGAEILEELPDVRRIVAGVGGGGLLAGIAAAVRQRGSTAEIVGVQPAGADHLRASLAERRVVVGGRPSTFADGLATRHVGDLPLRILLEAGATAYAVDDRAIARASFLLLEQAKILAEGAGAAALAGVLENPSLSEGGPVLVVVSGGNLDPFLLDRILFIGLASEGRILRLRAAVQDLPGRLAELLQVAARASANVRHIVHERESPNRPPGEVSVDFELEVRDSAHGEEVVQAYRQAGWTVERIRLGRD